MNNTLSSITISVTTVFQNIFTVVSNSIPPGTGMILLTALLIGTLVAIFVFVRTQPTPSGTLGTQISLFRSTFDSLAAKREGVNSYLKDPNVITSINNWVLLNFAPLTVSNAGYLGPEKDGIYDPQAIRQALDLGFRCFIFDIDYYQGIAKDPALFVPPGEPCLLHRDDQGVIRSANCGRIDQMMNTLAEQAFSRSLNTGNDPLLVILNFKNTPDQMKEPGTYSRFLSRVSEQIQPLRKTFLARINQTVFSNLSNPNALFVQKFQDLQGKTLIFTNANTDIFTSSSSLQINKNLRSMINAQIYSSTGSSLEKNSVTQVAPQGTQMAVGTVEGQYFLQTPPDRLTEAVRKTNNVFTIVNTPDANTNYSLTDYFAFEKTYGVQCVGWNLYKTPTETEAFLKAWGKHSWKLKPSNLQYIVVKTEPPKPISKKADANQGNPSPPSLRL